MQAEEQALLVGDPPVHRADRTAGVAGQVGHGQLVEFAGLEELLRGLEDPLQGPETATLLGRSGGPRACGYG